MTGTHPHLSIEQFAEKLAPVLGNEQASMRVREAIKQLAYRGERLSPDEQRGVLRWLGQQPGVVAAAARHLLRQFDRAASPQPVKAPSAARLPSQPKLLRDELVEALSRALGTAKASQVVDQACRERGILPQQLTRKGALDLLEGLSAAPGIVGVTARFAKARLTFKFEQA